MGKQASVTLRAHRETAWRNRLARYAGSEQTVQVFCRSEAVPVGTFYGWRARLRGRDADATLAPPTVPARSPFVDLGSVGLVARAEEPTGDNALHHPRTSIDVRLELGGGVMLHIVRH